MEYQQCSVTDTILYLKQANGVIMKFAKLARLLVFLSVILIACSKMSYAQITLSVNLNPSTPLPGDLVKGTLTIKTGLRAEDISGVTFYSPLPVKPQSISGIGVIPADSYYSLPFTLKATSPGTYVVKVYVTTTNGTVMQSFNVNVANAKPEIIITQPLTLGEVNDVHFHVYNPVNAYGIKVIPLFKAYPSTIYVVNDEGSFRFYPEKAAPLKFRIEFYNALAVNYHSYIQVVYPSYRNSSGLNVNVSTPHDVYLLYDVIPVQITFTNLRTDSVYDLRVNVSSNSFRKMVNIAELKPGEKKDVVVYIPANRAGRLKVSIIVDYKDYLGNGYDVKKSVEFRVLPDKVVSISDVSVERSGSGFEITGDVSNSGWNKIYGVTVTAESRGKNVSYFIGTIDPSDYDTFDIVTNNATKLVVSWQDITGNVYSVSTPLHLHSQHRVEVKESVNPLFISISGAAVILIIVILAVLSVRKRSGKDSGK